MCASFLRSQISSGIVVGVGEAVIAVARTFCIGSQSLMERGTERQGSEGQQGAAHTDWTVEGCGHREA